MDDTEKYGAEWDGTDPLTGQPFVFDGPYFYDSPIAPTPTKGKSVIFHISLGFAQMKDDELDTFASHVAKQLTDNATLFPDLPVTPVQLTPAQKAFHDAIAAASEGGKSLTMDKNAKRETLNGLLRQDATAIEAIPGMTPETAALSGYDINTPVHHQAMAPDTPVILGITNLGHGQLGVKLKASDGARGYLIQYTATGNQSSTIKFFSSTRNMVLDNLIPGTTYAIQACALGGNNQNSDWCAPVSCMCT